MIGAEIIVRRDSFTIVWPRRPAETWRFDSVTRIAAYKRDLFTIDLICCDITISSGAGAETRSVDEEMPGYDNLMSAFAAFPGFNRTWQSSVVKPAFVENLTTLFERAPR